MKIERLFPVCKDYLWGGHMLPEKYGKKTDMDPCAESWELSFHPDGETKLANGQTLKECANTEDLGPNVTQFPFFPMLTKFIDAKQNLSVQVHPSDEYALKYENSYGKTEMWIVIEAEEGAGLYMGLNRDMTAEEFGQAIEENKLTDSLNFIPVKAGDVFFIPSGTIHAIAAGCLIFEIQQSSNLTYRVYDYGRVGKDGKPRELHVEKAKQVTNLKKFEYHPVSLQTPAGEVIGLNRYFTTLRLKVSGETVIPPDPATFHCFTCVKGSGLLESFGVKEKVNMGDSFLVSAQAGEAKLEGDMEMIVTCVRKYYVGIDLGGTFIKGGIVDDLGNILLNDKIPTESDQGADHVAENIASLVKSLLKRVNLLPEDVQGIGIGVPGMIDSQAGNVIYSNNLAWKDFSIAPRVSELTGCTVKIANDANVAALGEQKFGSGKQFKDIIFLTLGTGVGGGIVIDGKLYEGVKGVGAELGHSAICFGGELCTCGRRGCLEAYASATALIRETRKAMQANPQTKLWKVGDLDKVNGETAFLYEKEDADASKVVEDYIEKLAYGIVNFVNEFRPEAIILGGGVCAQGDRLTKPLQAYVDQNAFGAPDGPVTPVLIAELGNRAGLLGAAALLM